MIPKWKTILTNWINCYTSEDEKREQNITPENLLNIFTHIYESFRLDDSKSSKFEANTIQDFIVEKYPEFKFENGTLEATCEEEVYIVASLLLFFICVNSKNVDIKRAMCSKLSASDQETIMKFSKCLMECSPIMYADVEAAISEACEDVSDKVAATPPALRSLHSEVRRLQAALDAERFDRNYLQDELARTNLKLEKLTKVKEQYKLDILSLKAKISLCCGEKQESHREARADEFIGRLQRQLQELEGRLEDTLGQLEDVQQEKDTYKQKVADLKQERDKWLSLSQQEADKAGQLADQLDAERRTVATLRDLVSELRQHNRNNGLDSSMLECDDPDTSIHSLNLSVCNEACANVIEVQLGEERAKIEILKQQIQSLQDQLCKTNQNFESEKLSLEAVITEKDNNLFNLKQRVDKEIEEKHNLKTHYEHEIDKLNKKIIELSLTIKDLDERSKNALAEKAREIQLLQKKFADENDKLGNTIQNLQKEIEEERMLKKHSEEEIDKLNNKIIEMLQTIKHVEESSKHYLSVKEQEIRSVEQQLANKTEKSNNSIKNLEQELQDLNNLKTQCEQKIVELKKEIGEISQTLKYVDVTSKNVQEEKEQQIRTLEQQIEKEIEKFSCVIKTLQEEVKEQTNLKTRCDHEIAELNNKIVEMTETAKVLEEHSKHTLKEKEQEIESLQQQLKNENEKSIRLIENLQKQIGEHKTTKTHCEQEIYSLNNTITNLSHQIQDLEEKTKRVSEAKNQEILTLKQENADITKKYNEVITKLQKEIEQQINLKTHCEQEIVSLNNKITDMFQQMQDLQENSKHDLEEKVQEIQMLQHKFASDTANLEIVIKNLEKNIDEQNKIKQQCDQEMVLLNNEIVQKSETINDLQEHSKRTLEEKVLEIQTLHQQFYDETEKSNNTIKSLQNVIDEQNIIKTNYEQDIEVYIAKVEEMSQKIKQVEDNSKLAVEEKVQEMQSLQQHFEKQIEEQTKLRNHREQEIVELNNTIVEMTLKIDNLSFIDESTKLALEAKEEEKQQLQQQLTDKIKKSEYKIENLKKELETEKHTQLKLKEDFETRINTLNAKVSNQKKELINLNHVITQKTEKIELIQSDLIKEKQVKDELSSTSNLQLTQLNDQKVSLENNIVELQKQLLEKDQIVDKFEKEVKNLKVCLSSLEQKCKNLLIEKQEEVERLNQEIVKLNGKMSDLIKEKQVKDELSSTSNLQLTQLNDQKVSLENNIVELQKQLLEKDQIVDKFEKEVKNLKVCLSSLEQKCKDLLIEKQEEVERLNQEIVKLNGKIVEMSQTIKDLQELSKHALEEKMQEMGTLQQQFAADSGKSENIMKNLKIELEAEKYAQLKLKDDFDNRFMKLNEKVLNRNNELVELQNNIIQKSELIEVMQADLRREKELRDELSNTCNDQLLALSKQKNALENNLQEKLHEIAELQKELHETEMFIPKLNKEIENLKSTVSSLEEKGRHRECIIKDKQKEIEFLNDIFQKEQEKLNYKMDERSASIKSLQMQLQNEIEYKVQLQRELTELQTTVDASKSLVKDFKEKALACEKQTIDMNEQIQANVDKVASLEEANVLLVKELEELKAAQNIVANDHKAKALVWEKEKVEIEEEMQANVLKVEKLEKDKVVLLEEIEALKATRRNEINNNAAKTLAWEKEKNVINDRLQDNILKVKKLENEKDILMKEMDVLKDAQSRLTQDHEKKTLMGKKLENEKLNLLKEMEALKSTHNEDIKTHEVKTYLLEKETTKMREQIQTNDLKIEILENEKVGLLKQVKELQATQIKETKDYENNALRWDKQKHEMEEQMQVSVLKLEKVEEEKMILMKENEALKAAQTKDAKAYDENALAWEKEKIEMEKEIQDYVLKLEHLENEKTNLIKEIKATKITQSEDTKVHQEEKAVLLKEAEELKATQIKQLKDYEQSALMWEKQKTDMEEQIQANIKLVEKLENEKTNLMKEILELKSTQIVRTKAHEENAIMWEKQKIEMEEQIKINNLKLEQLEGEKTVLQKELEAIKVAQSEEMKSHEENALVWKTQQTELDEQIQANILKIMQLENEVRSLKETEALKTVQNGETGDQISEIKEQVETNDLIVKKFEEEQAILLQELEELKVAEKTKTKDYEEKALLWEKEKTEMNEQLRAKNLKVQDLEEEKGMILKKVGELMAAEMEEELCLKKNHEEKILMLENQESEMKLQFQANILKVEQLQEENMILQKEVEALKAAQKEMLAAVSQDKITGPKHTSWEREMQGLHHQVDTTTSDLAHSSMESLKTISDLEKIVQDKNRKITAMHTEISYLKSMMAESGIKLIDVTKELEVSKDTCQELSSQLKKIVQLKNEEIAELKRQVAKMSVTENRASQIIKVSAKYQAMILKRIAEIKSSAVLKELTNFGNQNSNDTELRRSLAGSVTMEDLENFLETTDRHLKRCSEKQIALQKDRDRLSEVNRINESEIINMKKFLTEMSVSFRTFTTVKEVYTQKLSKIVSLQRTVRRDLLSLDGRITEATMCKLERGYAAVMQDLSECAMNLERWVDRSVSRLLSAEKIKQAFTSDLEQASLSTCNYQNAAVEVQLSELDNSFQKLLAEIERAQKGDGARNPQEVTIMEVRAEYEDKLNRMKAKMKELFNEEMGRLKQKQSDEIAVLKRELLKSKEKMAESSRAYEEHIRALTTELWSVGEKYLVKQEEANWLRKNQSGSLMSLQHVHSSGLHVPQETFGRPSDTHSLRSLPMHNKKSEARGMHMSDEEGEVFDNRFLKELSATPRASLVPGQRISELKQRNSLCPPHLKSSYPAEMQFAPTLDEEDIKCAGTSFSLGRGQRKEVGITAYKKPGPPTPSKQAGRLSATDSELRESLRVEADPQGRKTSTPSRIRSLFRSNRTDLDAGTPRSRRFSSIFRKK